MTARRSTYDVLPDAPDPAAEAERAKHGWPWCDTCQRPSIGNYGLQHKTDVFPFGVPREMDTMGHEVTHQQWYQAPTTRAWDLPLRDGETLTVEEAEAILEPLAGNSRALPVRHQAALRVLLDRKGVALTELPEPDRETDDGVWFTGDEFEIIVHDDKIAVWLARVFIDDPVQLALSLLAAHTRRTP